MESCCSVMIDLLLVLQSQILSSFPVQLYVSGHHFSRVLFSPQCWTYVPHCRFLHSTWLSFSFQPSTLTGWRLFPLTMNTLPSHGPLPPASSMRAQPGSRTGEHREKETVNSCSTGCVPGKGSSN